MKELLKSLHQRPITFYPIYAKITGSVSAGVVLSQLMYWFGVCEGDKFYKTDAEIQDETLLSEKQFRAVKEKLKELKFLTISREGLPAKTYYQINWEIYENELKKASKLDTPKRAELDMPKRAQPEQTKRDKQHTPKRAELYRNNLLQAEITTEITTENLNTREKTHKALEQNKPPEVLQTEVIDLSPASFGLKAELPFEKLSDEYKQRLAEFIALRLEANPNWLSVDEFFNSLACKNYRYKNYALAYIKWNTRANNTSQQAFSQASSHQNIPAGYAQTLSAAQEFLRERGSLQ